MNAFRFLFHKLRQPRILERVLRERLAEPLHLTLISLFVAIFGTLRQKIYFDLIVRQQNAFSILRAADLARTLGLKSVTLVEFGVAAGAGLLNIAHIAKQITRATGVEFRIVGFDTGDGMPPAADYRDHPELYSEGDYPMGDRRVLEASLPSNCSLVIGDLAQTAPAFAAALRPDCPLGFVSLDVDYYKSSKDALKILSSVAPDKYLPIVYVYLDDIEYDFHNPWCGELAAVNEFNAQSPLRKISPLAFLREKRLFKRANWISHIYALHVLDHAHRSPANHGPGRRIIDNPYL